MGVPVHELFYDEETRAIALGLMELGLQKGERIAIIGSNRPPLYWSMVAAQMATIAIPIAAFHGTISCAVSHGMSAACAGAVTPSASTPEAAVRRSFLMIISPC